MTESTVDPSQITIKVKTEYLDEQSEPEKQCFAFRYTITIHNASYSPIQLLARHWVITNADAQQEEVHGEGVIGEKPLIGTNATYSYSSHCVLNTPVGSMSGSYHMVTTTGEAFQVPIPRFTLAIPNVLH
ncbi:Co2+/Mg2+ efflux protein ApaG [Zooshikella harenae]|uniref:Protein ApaG n=1 Tax=Zooshikella harenae TaxID=2827238 RepID=A0ABS5Z915_9GAMM|nr:Co2+/Mg2+ efflux protein ApaG [Zooshikella harenae]MBU2710541.1 Co2+/Mg2+ efflux protein ApaG [Zooshikella harenae]